LTPERKVEVEKWARDQAISRSEALRRLIERGLKTLPSGRAASKPADTE
jgi:hypothetical protein